MNAMTKFVFGVILILGGLLFGVGFIILITREELQHPVAAVLVAAFFTVVVPIGVGGWLIQGRFKERQGTMLEKQIALQTKREKEILSLAKQKGGSLTVLDIASETSMSTTEAEQMMKDMMGKGYVKKQDMNSEGIVYEFLGMAKQNAHNDK
jgi:cytochrome b